jgi:hypothetical protein
MIKLTQTQDNRLTFTLVDTHKLKPGNILSHIIVTDNNRLIYAYNNCKLIEITYNTEE